MDKTKIFNNCIIVNPTAGDGQSKKRWINFERELNQNHIKYQVYFTKYKNHATKLTSVAIKAGFNRIGVFSGDGTLNEVIQGLFESKSNQINDIKLIFFPSGSSCDFEKKFEHRRGLIERIKSDDSVLIDIFKVECQNAYGHPICRYIVNNSSIGIISEANERFNSVSGITKKIKQLSIDLGAILCGLKAIRSFNPFQAQIKLDKKNIINKALSNVTIFKTSHFGGNMNYGIKTVQDDGRLSIVLLDSSSKKRLLSLMPFLFTGTIMKRKESHYRTCSNFEIYTKTPMIVEADGENIGYTPANYTILPKKLNIIT